ncbi:MAG: hypothetical protein AAFU71_01040 [Cyanobacteria bacterium J06632_22]
MKQLSIFLSLFGLLAIAPTALAQSAAPDGLSGDSSNTEVFSGSGVDFYDLIHQAGRLNTNPADFNRQQQRRIPNAVEDFRQRQEEAIRQETTADATAEDETVITD